MTFRVGLECAPGGTATFSTLHLPRTIPPTPGSEHVWPTPWRTHRPHTRCVRIRVHDRITLRLQLQDAARRDSTVVAAVHMAVHATLRAPVGHRICSCATKPLAKPTRRGATTSCGPNGPSRGVGLGLLGIVVHACLRGGELLCVVGLGPVAEGEERIDRRPCGLTRRVAEAHVLLTDIAESTACVRRRAMSDKEGPRGRLRVRRSVRGRLRRQRRVRERAMQSGARNLQHLPSSRTPISACAAASGRS